MNDSLTPANLADAFGQWLDLQRAANGACDDDAMDAQLARAAELERLAVTLPTESAADVWRLICMTRDRPTGTLHLPADVLTERAYTECKA